MLRLKINELAYIKEADIRLDGVTCIAGINNTGKSTIGKVLFSLIYSLSNYQDLFEEDRAIFIQDRLRLIRILLNRNDRMNLLNISPFSQEASFPEFISEDLAQLKNHLQTLEDADNKKIIELIDEILVMLAKDENDEGIKKEVVEQIILRTFEEQVSPLHSNNETKVSVFQGGTDLLFFTMKDNEITNFNMVQELPFNQVVYIESPYVFQLMSTYQMVSKTRAWVSRRSQSAQIPDYIRDLLHKMTNSHPSLDSVAEKMLDLRSTKTSNKISKLIGGEMFFDEKSREFYFEDETIERPIKMANVASGIKSMSIVHKLLQNGWLDELSVLIIDEPENHLHPSWQIEFARFLVDLYVESDIKILITSHSPYFIEAIDVFSKQRNIQDKTAFYSAEPSNEGTMVKDVTNYLESIFTLLSKPLEELEKERLKDVTE